MWNGNLKIVIFQCRVCIIGKMETVSENFVSLNKNLYDLAQIEVRNTKGSEFSYEIYSRFSLAKSLYPVFDKNLS